MDWDNIKVCCWRRGGEFEQCFHWYVQSPLLFFFSLSLLNKTKQAVDLLAVLRSFTPPGGFVQKVSIIPTEFGAERMKMEDEKGPQTLWKDLGDEEEEEEEEDDDDDEDDKDHDINSESK